MSSKRLTRDQVTKVRQMLRDGVLYQEIAEAFGVSHGTVSYHAKQAGLTRNHIATAALRGTRDTSDFHEQPWSVDALCAQTDPDAFFPEKGGSTREPKAVCAQCPVQQECLTWSVDTDQRFGVWGGLSERERRKLKKTQPDLAQTGTDATVPIPAAVTDAETETAPPRHYGMPYVGGANGGNTYPLPNPDRPVHIEQRATRKPSIDWDKIRAEHEARRRAEGSLDQESTVATVTLLRCRWCRKPADDLVDDVCGVCRYDAEQQFHAPDPIPDLDDLEIDPDDVGPDEHREAPPTSPWPSHLDQLHDGELLLIRAGLAGQIERIDRALASLDASGPVAATPAPQPAAATGTIPGRTEKQQQRHPLARRTRANTTEIKRRYLDEQQSIPDIARALDHSTSTVRRTLTDAGVQLRDDRATKSGGRNQIKAYPDELVAAIRTRYVDHGMTQAQVAADLDISTKVVQNVMARHHITPRPPASHPGTQPGVDRARGLKDRIADLGVASRDIKTWALKVGLIDQIARGVCPTHLVDAYALAHGYITHTTKENHQ